MIQDPSWDSTQTDDENNNDENNFDSSSEQTSNNASANAGSQDDGGLSQLQIELESAKNKLAELTNISQQALADLQNYKKRTEEEKSKLIAFANHNLMSELIPVLDNLDRALHHLPEDPTAKEWAQGLLATFKQLEQILVNKGLEPIHTSDQDFDPAVHEALMTDHGPADRIMKELEKGYKLGEKILRRSKVMVGNGQEKPSDDRKAHPKKD